MNMQPSSQIRVHEHLIPTDRHAFHTPRTIREFRGFPHLESLPLWREHQDALASLMPSWAPRLLILPVLGCSIHLNQV